MEPENAHVVSAVSVPQLHGTTWATFTNPSLLRATLLRGMFLLQLINVIDTISKRWRRKKAFNTGGPSWWTWFWQLAQLLKKELQLLVIIRHLHLGPSQQCLVVLGQKTWVNRLQAFLSKLGWFSADALKIYRTKRRFCEGAAAFKNIRFTHVTHEPNP